MTLLKRDIPDSPFLRPVVGDRLSVSIGEQFRASLGIETAGELTGRRAALGAAEGERRNITQGPFLPLVADFLEADEPEPPSPRVHPEELNKRYRNLGLNFTRPWTEEAARIIADGKRAEKIRQDIISRGPGGALGVGATLAGGLIATAIDPIELATAFVPVVGEARLAGMVARVGALRARTAAGAIEGAVGNVLTEPLVFSLSRQQQLDYGMADAALNVLLGTALGTIGGAARGLTGRQVRVQTASEPPFSVPVQSVRPRLPETVRRMSNEDRLVAHRAALAQIAQGRSVDLLPYERRAGAEAVPARAGGPETITQWLARTGGVNDADPTFRGEIGSLGDRNIRGVDGKFVGKLARPGIRRNLDDAADIAQQEGFIQNRDVRELMDAIDRDMRGEPVVRRQDIAEQMDRAEATETQQRADRDLGEFDATLEGLRAAGIRDVTPEDVTRIAEIMRRDGLDADDAVERLAIQDEGRIAAETAEREMRPERDGAADFDASARIERDLADDLDLDADIEESLSVVEQMRQDGRLTRQEEEEIAEVDGFAEKARTYGETARVAAACLSS